MKEFAGGSGESAFYRVSMKPPLLRASGGLSSDALCGRHHRWADKTVCHILARVAQAKPRIAKKGARRSERGLTKPTVLNGRITRGCRRRVNQLM